VSDTHDRSTPLFLGFFAVDQKSDPVFRCAPKFGTVGTKKIHIFGQYFKKICTKNSPQTEKQRQKVPIPVFSCANDGPNNSKPSALESPRQDAPE